ncbi:MAG: putative sensor domain DACNV-containing protein [Syntrophobacteraceae bacterium]
MDKVQEYLCALITEISAKPFANPSDLAIALSKAIENTAFPYSGPTDIGRIQAFIEEGYYAGLATEEARQLSFRLLYLPNMQAFPFRFLAPLPYNVENLIKLAPIASLDSDMAIYVQSTDDPGFSNGIQIVGIGQTLSENRGVASQIERTSSLVTGWQFTSIRPGSFHLFCQIAVIEFIRGKVRYRKVMSTVKAYSEWEEEVVNSILQRCGSNLLDPESVSSQ